MKNVVKNLVYKSKLFLVSPKGLVFSKIAVISFVMIFSTKTSFSVGTNITNSIENLWGMLQKVSPYAAGVGVATGAYMKFFSLGKQDKIDTGNKLIRDSILGWFMINALGLILEYLSEEILGGEGGNPSNLTYN